jgi:prephenate dehydrogenase
VRIQTLAIVGVGLIGASVGLAAKRRGVAERVVGVGRRPEVLDQARALGAIDAGSLELPAAAAADVVVVCTPVDLIAAQILDLAPACKPGTLLTDAGSAKAAIVEQVEARLSPGGAAFVGSHPLAGSEKRGPEFADADLFRGRLTVVTHTPRTNSEALERTVAFWMALGSRVRLMSPAAHDRALAMSSHLPHLAASALAGVLPQELHEVTATGFRDTTRVAAGDPSIWTGIFLQNRAAVLDALGRFADRLDEFQAALKAADADAVDRLLSEGKKVRDALGS